MEWKPGLILRIRNYKFEDDGSTRDKYAIISSQNNLAVPGIHYWCAVYQRIPYYFIPAGQIIGNENYYFDRDTFIFFQSNIRKESFDKFEAAAKSLWGIVCLGQLTSEELSRIIKCALKSRFIPNNIADELVAFKSRL